MATDIQAVLAYTFESWDLGKPCTIRYYLVELAKTCWDEGESFSGKRPFGNGGWQHAIYSALADGGFVTGDKDEDGCWDNIDRAAANEIIQACFVKLQEG